jgi:hypothetical protein
MIGSMWERFWGQVRRLPDNKGRGCWEWQGGIDASGYGSFWTGDRIERAHRMALLLGGRQLKAGQCVCHKCDNRRCVRPSHLFIGSRADNAADMRAKGRGFIPPPRFGQGHPGSKLTRSAVREIRRANGTQKEIAKRFGISQSNVCLIRQHKIWKEIP